MSSLEGEVRSLLSDTGYGAVRLSPGGSGEEGAQMAKAKEANADHLLVLTLMASTKHEAEFNMDSAQASSAVVMYNLRDGSELFTATGPSSKGFGPSASGAAWNAAGKVEKGLLKVLKDKLSALR